MRTDHVIRTSLLSAWLVALLLQAPMDARTGLIGVAIAFLGAAQVLRSRVTAARVQKP
ncbi:hypothetical protein AB0G04_26005 [Actinoplanes sp. NPDC023801]|uniref:hypothetical protein n=1 Tax=Actinoplanes sp. NPDC023801 TaxID=3154595 RepID=UPI00340E4C00